MKGGNNIKTIVIDPGHGGSDRSNRGHSGKYIEADGNLTFTLFLKDYLKDYFNVILTRETDKTLSLTERANIAIENNADMFISIHSDAFKDSSAGGVTVFDSVDLENEDIAKRIGVAVAKGMKIKFRSVKERESTKYPGEDYYTVIDKAQDGGIPIVVLLERGFHSNPEEERILLDNSKVRESARLMAEEIKKYFEVGKYKEELTLILGKIVATKEQMKQYLLSVNPNPQINCTINELIEYYIEEGENEGVRGDIAFAQALKETGYFKYGGIVLPSQNNFAGIGALNNNKKGQAASFPSPRMGVRAQIQHLKGYASTKRPKTDIVDPRYKILVDKKLLGTAPNFEDLGGKWAWPGYDKKKYKSLEEAKSNKDSYGHSIIKIFYKILSIKTNEPNYKEIIAKKDAEIESLKAEIVLLKDKISKAIEILS